MDLYKNKYRTESIRLKGWDYSSDGFYFVTICTRNRECFFGEVGDEKMRLSSIGDAAYQYWQEIPNHFLHVQLDEYIVMPNHVHGIIVITNDNDVETQNLASLHRQTNKFGRQSKNIASIIRGYKIGVKKWSTMNNISFAWQSGLYEHIIRNEKSLEHIREYIINNPLKWELDEYHPDKLNMLDKNRVK